MVGVSAVGPAGGVMVVGVVVWMVGVARVMMVGWMILVGREVVIAMNAPSRIVDEHVLIYPTQWGLVGASGGGV